MHAQAGRRRPSGICAITFDVIGNPICGSIGVGVSAGMGQMWFQLDPELNASLVDKTHKKGTRQKTKRVEHATGRKRECV